ncbi:hypothetical protein Hanom_Chr05g00399271 [Helianthus anomalus]
MLAISKPSTNKQKIVSQGSKIKESKIPFSSLRFGQFCDFLPKVCVSASAGA